MERGSCESVRRVSTAPSTLRLARAVVELRFRITALGGWTGWKPESAYFYSRAFRFTRKGYAASIRQQSCQRLRSCYALAWQLR